MSPKMLREWWKTYRDLLIGSLLYLLGLFGLGAGEKEGRSAGFVFLLIGGGILWLGGQQRWEAWRRQRTLEEKAAERAARKQQRQARDAQRRQQRQALKEVAVRAEAGRLARQAEERAAHQQQAAQDAAQRAERERLLAARVEELLSLTSDQLADTVLDLFIERGMEVHFMEEAFCDLLLRTSDGEIEVARCLPVAQVASVADIQALEAWRRDVNGSHAYLIALDGFAPAAVRLSRTYPLTLVEAHLLASWSS